MASKGGGERLGDSALDNHRTAGAAASSRSSLAKQVLERSASQEILRIHLAMLSRHRGIVHHGIVALVVELCLLCLPCHLCFEAGRRRCEAAGAAGPLSQAVVIPGSFGRAATCSGPAGIWTLDSGSCFGKQYFNFSRRESCGETAVVGDEGLDCARIMRMSVMVPGMGKRFR